MTDSSKRFLLLIFLLFGMLQLTAQVLPKISKDSLHLKQIGRTNPSGKTQVNPDAIKTEINSKLEIILTKYMCMPDQEKTWKLVRSEATDLLQQYWRNGKLQGTKSADAYYLKMDNTSMTANDISNHRMILLAGVALVKPAEFAIMRIEKNCKEN